MLLVFSLIAVLFQVSLCDLKADRLVNAQIWIERANSALQTQNAYGPTVVNFSTIFHRVDFAGNFGPGLLALEYDAIVNSLELITGFNPVKLQPSWDVSTTRWLTVDILRVDYTLKIAAGKFTPQMAYIFDQEDFRFIEYIVFDSNSTLINTGFTVQDKGANTLFTLTSGAIPVEVICGGFIFGACSPSPLTGNISFIADTGFTDVADCITALSIINAIPNPCPYPQRSNTLDCRALHAISAFFLPNVHCAHVKKVSPVCNAQCLPACANCHPNATCAATFASDFPFNKASYAPVYKCVCQNGFSGDGLSCAPISCNPTLLGSSNRSTRICPSALSGSTQCIDNLCKCSDTFTPQPTNPTDSCGCPAPSKVRYVNKVPICVPEGRCVSDEDRYMCNLQEYNQVKCLSANNTFNPFKRCVCNEGFTGGMEYPCKCAQDKRIKWSPTVEGSVCLATNECTVDFDCTSPQICSVPSGKMVGVCVNM